MREEQEIVIGAGFIETLDKTVSMKEVGKYIAERRAVLGMTQRELAKATGYSDSYIAQLEQGQKAGSPELFKVLAQALRVKSGILQNKYSGEAESDYPEEVKEIALKILALPPKRRRHVENQIELLLESSAGLITDEVTDEQVKQAQAILDRYRAIQDREQTEAKGEIKAPQPEIDNKVV